MAALLPVSRPRTAIAYSEPGRRTDQVGGDPDHQWMVRQAGPGVSLWVVRADIHVLRAVADRVVREGPLEATDDRRVQPSFYKEEFLGLQRRDPRRRAVPSRSGPRRDDRRYRDWTRRTRRRRHGPSSMGGVPVLLPGGALGSSGPYSWFHPDPKEDGSAVRSPGEGGDMSTAAPLTRWSVRAVAVAIAACLVAVPTTASSASASVPATSTPTFKAAGSAE